MEIYTTLALIFALSLFAVVSTVLKQTTWDGALGGWIIGVALCFGLGWQGFVLLFLFFPVFTGIPTIFGRKLKNKMNTRIEHKGRGFWQAMANTGPPALCALLILVTPDSFKSTLTLGVIVGFTSVIADTVASEIGVLSKSKPISIITWRILETGSNGGISLLGTSASLIAVCLYLFCAKLMFKLDLQSIFVMLIIAMLSSVLDSLLGATLENIWLKKYGEKIANNLVNFVSVATATIAILLLTL